MKATGEACRALVELVGENLQELASEIDKLSLYAGHDEIGEDEVELLVAARADVPPFVLTDAWGRRDVGAVLGACESILERSTRSGEVQRSSAASPRTSAASSRCQRLDAGRASARATRPRS